METWEGIDWSRGYRANGEDQFCISEGYGEGITGDDDNVDDLWK